jgi:hypothetical protein
MTISYSVMLRQRSISDILRVAQHLGDSSLRYAAFRMTISGSVMLRQRSISDILSEAKDLGDSSVRCAGFRMTMRLSQ